MVTTALSLTEQLTGRPRISYEEFLALPLETVHTEWVDGELVPMPSVSGAHQDVVRFVLVLLDGYLSERPIGILRYDPFQIRADPRGPGRAPDVLVLLNEHVDRLHDLFVEGPADLIVEVVSPSGATRDYVEKFREYEAAGVPEYWVIDPAHVEATFFVLRDGRYEAQDLGADGTFQSTVLPGFWIRPQWLWERPKVNVLVAQMLAG
jgi:Uma2 family endonuclease